MQENSIGIKWKKNQKNINANVNETDVSKDIFGDGRSMASRFHI